MIVIMNAAAIVVPLYAFLAIVQQHCTTSLQVQDWSLQVFLYFGLATCQQLGINSINFDHVNTNIYSE